MVWAAWAWALLTASSLIGDVAPVNKTGIENALIQWANNTSIILTTLRDCWKSIEEPEFKEIIMNLSGQHPTFEDLPTDQEGAIIFFHRACEFLAYRDEWSAINIKPLNSMEKWVKIPVYEYSSLSNPST